MAAHNEETPLIGGRAQSVESRSIDGSSDTWTESRARSDEEELGNEDKAKQQVTKLRGLLIALSLWGLIFLQGKASLES